MRVSEQGFTLIELIIVVSMIGILLAIGAPNFLDWRSRVVYKDAAETVSATLRETRTLSHSQNRQYRVEFDLANRLYRVTQGNRSQNSSDFDTVIQAWTSMDQSITLKRDADCTGTGKFSIGFNANGTSITSYIAGGDYSVSSDFLCILDNSLKGYRVGVASTVTGRTVVDRHP